MESPSMTRTTLAMSRRGGLGGSVQRPAGASVVPATPAVAHTAAPTSTLSRTPPALPVNGLSPHSSRFLARLAHTRSPHAPRALPSVRPPAFLLEGEADSVGWGFYADSAHNGGGRDIEKNISRQDKTGRWKGGTICGT
jgi:hypothetical protein